MARVVTYYAIRGDLKDAAEFSNKIRHSKYRANALAEIAVEYAQLGNFEDALDIFEEIKESRPEITSRALASIAREYGLAGEKIQAARYMSESIHVALSIRYIVDRNKAMFEIVEACRAMGDADRACTVLSQIAEDVQAVRDLKYKSKVLLDIVGEYRGLGRYGEIGRILSEMKGSVMAIDGGESRGWMLFLISKGLMEIGQPKAGDTLVVSAAAGAVGSMVGQIGKIQACRVVGIAGSADKCRWLTETAGFDAAINYKPEDIGAALDKHCPDGIDINFENVGGDIMEAVIARLNDFSRMPLCGMISTYNDDPDASTGPKNFANLLMRRTRVQGFIVIDFLERFMEGIQAMGGWLMEGKIKYETDVVDGLENAPGALDRLFTGANLGKLVVRASEEPG